MINPQPADLIRLKPTAVGMMGESGRRARCSIQGTIQYAPG